jgi:hypothetical protein
MTENQPSPRRRFQFRLRTLMIVVTLLAVACGYVTHALSETEWPIESTLRKRLNRLRSLASTRFFQRRTYVYSIRKQ